MLDVVAVAPTYEVRASIQTSALHHLPVSLVERPHYCIQLLDGEVTFRHEQLGLTNYKECHI
jgi:hypothetical protein